MQTLLGTQLFLAGEQNPSADSLQINLVVYNILLEARHDLRRVPVGRNEVVAVKCLDICRAVRSEDGEREEDERSLQRHFRD